MSGYGYIESQYQEYTKAMKYIFVQSVLMLIPAESHDAVKDDVAQFVNELIAIRFSSEIAGVLELARLYLIRVSGGTELTAKDWRKDVILALENANKMLVDDQEIYRIEEWRKIIAEIFGDREKFVAATLSFLGDMRFYVAQDSSIALQLIPQINRDDLALILPHFISDFDEETSEMTEPLRYFLTKVYAEYLKLEERPYFGAYLHDKIVSTGIDNFVYETLETDFGVFLFYRLSDKTQNDIKNHFELLRNVDEELDFSEECKFFLDFYYLLYISENEQGSTDQMQSFVDWITNEIDAGNLTDLSAISNQEYAKQVEQQKSLLKIEESDNMPLVDVRKRAQSDSVEEKDAEGESGDAPPKPSSRNRGKTI